MKAEETLRTIEINNYQTEIFILNKELRDLKEELRITKQFLEPYIHQNFLDLLFLITYLRKHTKES